LVDETVVARGEVATVEFVIKSDWLPPKEQARGNELKVITVIRV